MSLLGYSFTCSSCSAEDDPSTGTVKIDMEELMRTQQEEREKRDRIEAEVLAAREARDLEDQERMRQVTEQREAAEYRLAEEQREINEQKAAEQRQKQIEEVRFAKEAADREADMKLKLDKLLKEYAVAEVNQKKKSLVSFKYPIHHAVEKGDAEAVHTLLHFKADASLLNSSKKTALQLAEKGKTKDETILSMLKF